jgi:colanic acid/amylovoran biosynthesis glycosyltransferase
MSRFPKLSETFVLYEILSLEQLGVEVDIMPLVREREPVRHREADRLAERAFDARPLSRAVLAAQWYWLRRRPRDYAAVWTAAVRGNLRSPKFLLRALAVVPLAATFARHMRRRRVDHIHAHWATHPALAAYVASRLTRIPYSFTAHAHDIFVERSMLREKIRSARFVVTISEYNRRFLERLYGREAADRLAVIHCGTDPDVFRPLEAAYERGAWTVICVATLQPQKGQANLVEACRLLVAEGIDLRCLLVGDGETRAELARRIRSAGLEGRVELLGYQPRHRVVELVGSADVVVQPSVVLQSGKTEGIPVSLMEALAMERPVVATAISGIPELIEDGVTGLLVPPGDPEALANALRTLYRDPPRALSLGQAGRRRVVAEFNQRTSARELADRFAESRTHWR